MKTYDYAVWDAEGTLSASGDGYGSLATARAQAELSDIAGADGGYFAVRETSSKKVVWAKGDPPDSVPDDWFKGTSSSALLWVAGGVGLAGLLVAGVYVATRRR